MNKIELLKQLSKAFRSANNKICEPHERYASVEGLINALDKTILCFELEKKDKQ